MSGDIQRILAEEAMKKHLPKLYEAYELTKKVMIKRPYSYPNVYYKIVDDVLTNVFIDFSLSYSVSYGKRFNYTGFQYGVSVSVEGDYTYPNTISEDELSYWLPRFLIKNLEYEKNRGYR